MSAAHVLEGNVVLDALFRHRLTDLLATCILAAHTGAPIALVPIMGGLAPQALRRAIERLHSDSDADVSLAAFAADAGLSRFHLCRAFKVRVRARPWSRKLAVDSVVWQPDRARNDGIELLLRHLYLIKYGVA